MRIWHKFFLLKNSEININLDRDKHYLDHEKSMGGYEENIHYKNKELFFENYLDSRQKYYISFLKQNLDKKKKILSIGSGRCAAELFLLQNGFNIVCSDLEIPNCYESSKKIFGNYEYKKFNIIKDQLDIKFDFMVSLSMIYAFEKSEIKFFFKKAYQHLNPNGILVFEPGACEDNLFSLLYDKIYLLLEIHVMQFIYKILGKKNFILKKHQGYKFTNKELIKLGKENGFEISEIKEDDYLTEFDRSLVFRYLIKWSKIIKNILKILGKVFPYIRIFKFKRNNVETT